MKNIIILILLLIAGDLFCQSATPPTYTTYKGFRMWSQAARPTADSLNRNWQDLDTMLHNLSNYQGIDNLNTKRVFTTAITATTTINGALGYFFVKTLSANNQTLIFSNLNVGQTIIVYVKNPSSYTGFSFSNNNIRWPDNSTPTQTVGNNVTDIYTFFFDGTYIAGVRSANYNIP